MPGLIHRCAVCGANKHSSIWHLNSPTLPIVKKRAAAYQSLFESIDIVVCHRCGCAFNRRFRAEMREELYGDVALTNKPVEASMHARLEELVQGLYKDIPCGFAHGRPTTSSIGRRWPKTN